MVLALVGAALAAPAAPAAHAALGVGVTRDVPVRMADGVTLRADVYAPTQDGRSAPGRFPVLLTQTPYTKTVLAQVASSDPGGQFADPAYFVPRGYVVVIADVRGTGGSQGSFRLLGPPEGRDGAELVRWAAGLPQSSGEVGLLGPSYMGITQLHTAAAVGPGSPLKAIFPVAAASDVFRDFAWHGGVANIESDALLLGVFTGLNTLGPLTERGEDPLDALVTSAQHLRGALDPNARLLAEGLAGTGAAFDGPFWHERSPQRTLDRVVANGVPAFLVGGWLDVFQRGELLNLVGLQNAAAGRPVDAPMRKGQRTTGRYQLLMGPWHHLEMGAGLDLRPIALRWFDRWLKGVPNGITRTGTPLTLQDQTTGQWRAVRRFPPERAVPTTYVLGPGRTGSAPHSRNDGALSRTGPAAPGTDVLRFTVVSSTCSRQTSQWSVGVAVDRRCLRDDRPMQQGPGALTYTTPVLPQDRVVAGPVAASLAISADRPDALLVATLQDVAPDGTSTPLTAGQLLTSHRALDRTRTWRTPAGRVLRPHHPHTEAALRRLTPGAVERVDVELLPAYATVRAGHRLRLTLTSADTPHLLPSLRQLPDLLGGTTTVHHGASTLLVPLARPDAHRSGCRPCEAAPR